ncbi:hypothetical protein KUTeg_010322 [Tegillarca granosa]|uniref:Uncharacterized protein n=1 Tax=Tegillarca granosa TaxID=220873 RepID=A0ABQ9F6E2_TEGGR|nr:hypothetical protein KUTeg_010322 [Tegillarca granosa]
MWIFVERHGGNTGIGKETALELAKRGARIIIGCRNEQKAEAAVQDIRSIGDQAYAVSGRVTKQNFDLVFGTNHLGHFMLTELLLDLLKISAPSRIINVSSFMHRFHFHPFRFDSTPNGYGKKYPFLSGYRISKLANVMHARELGKILEGKIQILIELILFLFKIFLSVISICWH